jgi:putative phage-type endonuclease
MTETLQGTPEWHLARLGKVTASRVADVVARTKNGYGASRANYMTELIAERLTGTPAPDYVSAAMQWGLDREPEARIAYELFYGYEVAPVGFIDHPSIAMCGASPDGLIGDDGLVEFKCPNTATHIDALLGATIEKKYLLQMQWQMACTGRRWCDYVSYDPRLPTEMQLLVQRVVRDDKLIEELSGEIVGFLRELDEKLAALKARYQTRQAA